MTLAFFVLSAMMPGGAEEGTARIHVSQVGYRPGDRKIACFVDVEGAFEVIRTEGGEAVYGGVTGEAAFDAASGDNISLGDFSAVYEPGVYVIRTAKGDSPPFTVGEDVYRAAADDSLRFFTWQRCGQALPEAEAGRLGHEACHTGPATIYKSDKTLDVHGGWHDAGDYGRYASAAGKAVLDLLLTARDFPGAFEGDALLDEIRYELEWLLRMQDGETGGVYHKVTSMAFPGMAVKPEADRFAMVLSPISPTAAGDFAAVTAYAAKVYAARDPGFSARLLGAARRAYAWLEANPDAPGFVNPPGITTGEYGDSQSSDERGLAAAALYLATGEAGYHGAAKRATGQTVGVDWADVGMYANILYLELEENMRDEAAYNRALNALIGRAEDLMKTAAGEGYGVAVTEYIWGSNGEVASRGMVLLLAGRLTGREDFTQAGLDQLHYLLGRNANGVCYLTGHGANPVVNPHHRPSVAARGAMPGMLSGGPNSGLEDRVQYNILSKLPPAKQFIDHMGSYATNEVAIYWNSPLVYLLASVVR